MTTHDDDAPSGFSIVKDSIRRDREALFGATRQAIPDILARGDDDSDGASSSDGELPVFFTTTEADADIPPFPSKPPREFSESTPAWAADAVGDASEEGDELAAFERAASQAFEREEKRSARLVAAHLSGDSVVDDADDQRTYHDADERDDDDDDDESMSVRASRRRQRPPPRSGHGHSSSAFDPASRRVAPPTNGIGDAVSALYKGWLSGAAGRLAGRGESGSLSRGELSGGENFSAPAVDLSSIEAEFVEATAGRVLDEHGNLPSEVAAEMPAPSVILDVERSIGGIDLDALLARLQTPEGQAALEADRTSPPDDLTLDSAGSESEDDAATTTAVPAVDTGWVRAQRGRPKSRPASAKPVTSAWSAEDPAPRGPGFVQNSQRIDRPPGVVGRGRAAPTRERPALDPYGRGTRRDRPAGRMGLGSTGAFAEKSDPDQPLPPPLPFNGAMFAAPEPTVRINAWETMDAANGNRTVDGANGRRLGPEAAASDDEASSSDDDEEWRAARRKARPGGVKVKPAEVARPLAPTRSAAVSKAEDAAAKASAAAAAAMAAAQRAAAAAEAREAAMEMVVERSRAEDPAAPRATARLRVEAEEASRAAAEEAAAGVRQQREAEEAAARSLEAEAAAATPAAAVKPTAADVAAAEERRMAGNALFRKGDYDGAVEAFSQALAKHEGDVASLANRAAAFLRLGDSAEAEADASRCLFVDPSHEKARHRRAQARVRLGDYAGALSDLTELHRRLPHHAGVAKDLAQARRLAAHADPRADAAAMEEKARERKEAAAREAAAWEAKRDAGLKAHKERRAAAEVAPDASSRLRTRRDSEGARGDDVARWSEVIEKHHPGRSIVHPLATFTSSRVTALPPDGRSTPAGAFTLSLDVTARASDAMAAALEWAAAREGGAAIFSIAAVALVAEEVPPSFEGGERTRTMSRRLLLFAGEDLAGRPADVAAAAAVSAAHLASDASGSEWGAASSEPGWDRFRLDPGLVMGRPSEEEKARFDADAEFSVGAFIHAGVPFGSDAAFTAAAAACRRVAEEGLDVVAMRSVYAADDATANALASFSPHRFDSDPTRRPTLVFAVRGRRAVARWRDAVGADVAADVAASSDPGCLRALLGTRVMSTSLSPVTARRELAFLFGGRIAPGTPTPPPGMRPEDFVAARVGAPAVSAAAPRCVAPEPVEHAWILLPGDDDDAGCLRAETLGAALRALGSRGFRPLRAARVPAAPRGAYVASREVVAGARPGTLAVCVEAEGARRHLARAIFRLLEACPRATAVVDAVGHRALVSSLGASSRDAPSPAEAAALEADAESASEAKAREKEDAVSAGIRPRDAAEDAEEVNRVCCVAVAVEDAVAAGVALTDAFAALGHPALLGARLLLAGLLPAGLPRDAFASNDAAASWKEAPPEGPLLVAAVRGPGVLSATRIAAVLERTSATRTVTGAPVRVGVTPDAAAARRVLARTFTERDVACPASNVADARFERPLQRPLLPALLAPPPVVSAAVAVSREGLVEGSLERILTRAHGAGFTLAGLRLVPDGLPARTAQLFEAPGGGDRKEDGPSASDETVAAVVHLRRVDGVRKILDVVRPVPGVRVASSLAAAESTVAAVFGCGDVAQTQNVYASDCSAAEAGFGLGLGPEAGHAVPGCPRTASEEGEVGGSSLRQLGCVVLPLGRAGGAPMPAVAAALTTMRKEGFTLVGLRSMIRASDAHGREAGVMPRRVALQLAGRCKGLSRAGEGAGGEDGAGIGEEGGFMAVAVTRDNAVSRLGAIQRRARAAASSGGGGGGRVGAGEALEGTAAKVFAAAHVSVSPSAGCKEAAYLFERLDVGGV